MMRGELKGVAGGAGACMGRPRFHVKHVDTELSVIAEACGQRRTLGWPRWNGGGFMTCQNVGCCDNRAAGWGISWKHREVRTRPDQCLPILVEWAELGRGSGTGLYPPPHASVLESRGR